MRFQSSTGSNIEPNPITEQVQSDFRATSGQKPGQGSSVWFFGGMKRRCNAESIFKLNYSSTTNGRLLTKKRRRKTANKKKKKKKKKRGNNSIKERKSMLNYNLD